MTNSGGTITPERGKASRSTRSCRARGEAITAVAFTAARKKGDRSRRPRLAAECRARVHRPRFKGSCLRVRRRLPSLAHSCAFGSWRALRRCCTAECSRCARCDRPSAGSGDAHVYGIRFRTSRCLTRCATTCRSCAP